MLLRSLIVLLFVSAVLVLGQATDPAELARWIRQLGAEELKEREAAAKRLEQIGTPALPALREAAKADADAEVRLRAGRLVKIIERSLFTEARRWQGHQGTDPIWGLWVTRLAVSPDGRHFVSAGGDGLKLWDAVGGKMLLHFGKECQRCYWALAFSLDGRRLIAGGDDRLARVWDMPSGKLVQTLTGHSDAVWGAVLTNDGRRAATGGWDKKLLVWDVDTGKLVHKFDGIGDKIRGLALSPDGKRLAAAHFIDKGPATVRLWDLASFKEERSLKGHDAEVTSVSFSRDGKNLMSSSFDRTIRLWDVEDGRELKCLRGHNAWVEWAAFLSDGKRVISCGGPGDATVKVWDLAAGRVLHSSEPGESSFLCVTALPDGRQCLGSSKDGLLRLWHLKN
ncbi:MAG: WD40 repeat domain-containing protein [Planctomycetaceae bacterium]|nr:WD40 repeat domain-containing protein [Planctomycetaceae bacterium]